MKVIELAELYKLKHCSQVVKTAQNVKKITPLMLVKDDLIVAFRNYVDAKTAKEPVLQKLANDGEPFCQDLVASFNELIGSLNKWSAKDIFHSTNHILGKINKVKNDPEKKVRNSIHDAFRLHRQTDWKERENIKSKLEMVLKRLSSMLEKAVLKLRKLATLEGPIEGVATEQERQDLSKGKILWFMRTPAAQHYGVDNDAVMTQLLLHPSFREKLTTLINAIDRGHIPADGKEIAGLASEMKHWLDTKNTNEPLLTADEDVAQQAMHQLKDPKEQWHKQMEDAKLQKQDDDTGNLGLQEQQERLDKAIEQRDLEHDKLQKKKTEEDLISKYNSLTLQQFLSRS